MRIRIAALGVLGLLAVPCVAKRAVTLEQLQQMLAGAQAQHRGDAALAVQVYDVELNARVEDAALAQLIAASPGPLTTQALRSVADISQFQKPAANALPSRPTPDVAAQRFMMTQTIHYVAQTLHRLPNFLATRQTDSYDDAAQTAMVGGWPTRDGFKYRLSFTAPITYHDGKEVDDAPSDVKNASLKKGRKSATPAIGLTSWGEFGPVLEIVLLDASKGKLGWSHWELRNGKTVAVFQFSVPQAVSHYNVSYEERLPDVKEGASFGTTNGGSNNMRQHEANVRVVQVVAAYHGELTVDPETGTVLRVVIEADMPKSAALYKAAMMVEYAPVRIGDAEYICPVHSVTLSEVQDLYQPNEKAAIENVVDRQLNDVRFVDYRRFGSEVKMLTAADAGDASAPAPAASAENAASAEPAAPADTPSSAANAAEGSKEEHAVVASAAPAAAVSDEEVIVRDVMEMPGMRAGDEAAAKPAEKNFTLQVSTRLVDIGVIVTDKRGKPVTDLKPDEIAIYDNGRPEKVAEFHHANAEAAAESAGPGAADATPAEGVYTNTAAVAQPAAEMPDLMVLLLDESHIGFNDLNRARGEVEKFLESARPGARLALYSVGEHGFRALQDVTTDRKLVEAKLKAWTPDAAGVSLAQEQDVRNKQQFDTVRSSSDLQYVNGNHENAPDDFRSSGGSGAKGSDPQLRKLGDDPLGRALLSLMALSRHFAPVNGHKSLVWISGDSALVDWRDQEVRVDRSVEDITAAIHHTMDALNEAHMALYVVDASLQSAGAATVDASLANPDVELAPTATEASRPGSTRDRSTTAGRMTAALQQDSRGIQGPVRQLAESTGGRAFNKGSDLTATLKTIAEDTAGLYEIGFHPDTPADGKFHTLKLAVQGRKDVKLRYRTGYLYNEEASTTKDRFQRAVWTPQDLNGITLRAEVMHQDGSAPGESLVRLRIGFQGLDLEQKGDRWTDDLYIFVAQRDDAAQKAQVTGDTLRLSLKQATYEAGMPAGIPYQHEVTLRGKDAKQSVRVVVVDGNSGKMGSVTIPAGAFVE